LAVCFPVQSGYHSGNRLGGANSASSERRCLCIIMFNRKGETPQEYFTAEPDQYAVIGCGQTPLSMVMSLQWLQ